MNLISGINESGMYAYSATSAQQAITDVNGYPITSYLPESGVGYNAVNEISGINGSAIAQYGHEAQWLVHDDTLVHAANSAQYALGVNLSAVAQLLGVDETVLYSGDYNGTITSYALNDNISSFEKIKVYGMTNDSDMLFTEFYTSPQPRYFSFFGTWSGMQLKTRCYVISNNTAFNNFGGVELSLGSTTTGTHQHIGITKVVGIGRKEV